MSDEELLALTSLFYEGAMSPQRWQEGLQKLAVKTSSQAASLLLWDRRLDHGIIGNQVGLPDELQRDYEENYQAVDPGREFIDQIAVGGWYLDERELGLRRIQRSPFYAFLRRYELDSTMASPLLRADHGVEGFLSLSSSAGRRDLSQVANSLARLMPHLQMAARLRMKFSDLSQQVDLSAQALDRFNFPLLVITANRKVVLSNRLGEEWLCTPANPLAASSSHAAQIKILLQDACGSTGKPRKAAGLALQRSDGSSYYLTAVPLTDPSSRPISGATAIALLMVNDPARGRQSGGALLQQIFKLSPAEIRLIDPLLRGATLQNTSAELNISVDTGRSHLKSIFAKLGISRQTDLHRLLGPMDIVEH